MAELKGLGRRELVEQLDALIAGFEQDGHEPDRWESFCLIRALDNLSVGHLGEVKRQIVFAGLPAELRPRDGFRRIPTTYEAMTAEELRGALEEVGEQPTALQA